MIVWIDAQLPPVLTRWFREKLKIDAVPVRDLGLRHATDVQIFLSARQKGAVVLTKDRDFADLSSRLGAPPQVVLVSCGNTSNEQLRRLLGKSWPAIVERLGRGEAFVEVKDDD